MSGRDEQRNRFIEQKFYEGTLTHDMEWVGNDPPRVVTRINNEFICWGYFERELSGKYVRVSIAVLKE